MNHPPQPGRCPHCRRAHGRDEPHDPMSLYYQAWFRARHGRWPSWADAMAHCPPADQERWRQGLRERGLDPDANAVLGH